MITPSLTFWWRLFATLTVEVCCLAALGFVAQRFARSVFWRRAAWQITVVCLLAAAASEWTGVGRALAMRFAPSARAVENKTNPNISPAPSGNPVEVQVAALPPTPQKLAGAVWWPGLIGLAGTVLLLGRTALAQGLLLILRFGRDRITDGPLREKLGRLSPRLGLRQKVCLRRMSALISPMAFGIVRPCIGLPAKFEIRFNPAEQDAILAHELAHLAARDPLWFLLADLAGAVLWWHPMAWWARQRLHVISEQAADEATALVPDGPKALAQCLVALGKEMAEIDSLGWVGINGGGFRSKLGRRVEGLLQLSGSPTPPLHGRGARTIKIAAMLAAAPLTVLAFGSMQTAQGPSDETWRSQFEKSWRQSPAGVLLLAKRDDQAKTPKTNRVEKLPSPENGGTNADESVWVENFPVVMPAGSGGIEVTNIVLLCRGINRTNEHENSNLAYSVQQFFTNRLSLTNPATTEIRKQTTIQNGKFLYEMGKYDEAEKLLAKVLKDDPSDRSALYYMDLIKEARHSHEPHPIPLSRRQPQPEANPIWVTNLVYTTKGKQKILSKLNTIILDEVSYDDWPLEEVVRRLRAESAKRDPDGIGVNFMINNGRVDASGELPPSTDLNAVIAAVPRAPRDLGAEVTIRISPPLRNVRLADVLEAVTKTADHPIRYTVEDFAVVFSLKTDEKATLYTKRFQFNPNTFVQAVEKVSGVTNVLGLQTTNGSVKKGLEIDAQGQSNLMATLADPSKEIHKLVRVYFTAAGVDFAPPKFIFINDRLGELLAKATLSDLEVIQKALDRLNKPPQDNTDADSRP